MEELVEESGSLVDSVDGRGASGGASGVAGGVEGSEAQGVAAGGTVDGAGSGSGRRNTILGYIAGIVTGVTYGLNPLFAKPLLEMGVSIDTMLSFRYLLAVLISSLSMPM